ncbi:MAG: VWA domain-containing protein [Candidatus Hydrogenedentes bacterium]|nr:VWA domain-containing protein [Candidatus Hydrogenedentota bacterium]
MSPDNVLRERFANPTAEHRLECVYCDILVKDVSPSMDEEGFETRKNKRVLMHEATASFLELKRERRPLDYVAIVTYGCVGQLVCPLVNVVDGHRKLCDALDQTRRIRSGGTCIKEGLAIALGVCGNSPINTNTCGLPTVTRLLAYTDGHDASMHAARDYAHRLKERGVVIETFGIARTPRAVNESFLREIATEDATGFVHYRFLGDGATISRTFSQLATGMLTFEA